MKKLFIAFLIGKYFEKIINDCVNIQDNKKIVFESIAEYKPISLFEFLMPGILQNLPFIGKLYDNK